MRQRIGQGRISVNSSRFAQVSALLIGVIVGITGPALTSTNGAMADSASVLLSSGWCYAAVAFCAGLLSGSKKGATAAGAVSLIVAVFSYYLTKCAQGDFIAADVSDQTGRATQFAWDEFASTTLFWGFISCILGPPLGIAGRMSRFGGRYRVVYQITIPAIALTETFMRLDTEAPMADLITVETWRYIRVAAVAAIIILLGSSLLSKFLILAHRQGRAKSNALAHISDESTPTDPRPSIPTYDPAPHDNP